MTNEELTVLDGIVVDLIGSRARLDIERSRCDELFSERGKIVNENKRLLDECNRLRESEANALNAAEEAKRERDEAKRRIQDAETCLNNLYWRYRINAGSPVLKLIGKYAIKYGVEIPEGRMAK